MYRTRPRKQHIAFISACACLCLGAPQAANAQGRLDSAPNLQRPAPVVIDETTAQQRTSGQWRVSVPDMAGADLSPVVSTSNDRAAAMVNRLYNMGRAKGLSDVLYDNRDGDHSRPRLEQLPQLRETRYAEMFTTKGLDKSLAGPFLFDSPVIGNASLAVTRGPFRRSLPRFAHRDQASAQIAHDLFAANHIYVYPEHRDHDPKSGDRFLAQTPYMVISQGSSGSDRPFLEALALTYAAFQPETFDRLRGAGLLASTAQMILRRTQKGITHDGAYFSPQAHPTVFDANNLRPTAMVTLAQSIRPDQIPPRVELRVLSDFEAQPGEDFLATNLSERLFTTPGAIARIWRSFEGQREMVVAADPTTDPNGHPLTFTWVLLRGNPEKVTIAPFGPGDSQAAITLDWHDADEIVGPDGLASARIDIGVFADNGFHPSAPAFLSIAVPLHQKREYAGRGVDARLWRVDYTGEDIYADPLVWPVAPWNDRLAHGPDGRVEVMTRQAEGVSQPYALHRDPAEGWVKRRDDSSRPLHVTHLAEGPPSSPLSLSEIVRP